VWINNFAFVSHDGGGTGSTSSGINGIPQGGVIAGDSEGRIGDATYFDGSDDGIALGTDLMVVEDFTVSLFTKSTEPFSTTYRPHYFGAGNYFYLITETTGKPKIYRHSSDGWLYAEQTTGTQAYNDWVFLSGTYDGSSLKIYENGLHVGSEMATGNLSTPSTDLYVGYAYSGAANQWMHGVIDEVRISNTARSQGWISAEYTNQNTPTDFYTITGYIASTPSSPAILTGLTLGETYTFTAKSKNGGGISDFSQPSNEVTLDYEPDAPTGLNVTDAIDSSIDLEWTAPDNVVLPDNLDYHIFYRETGSADWIRIEPDPETSETTASITGLTNGTAYDVAVQAVNDAGKSAYATLDGNIPYSPPSEPRNLQAQVNDDGLGNVTVELTFDPPADDGGGVDEYRVYNNEPSAAQWYNTAWSGRSKLTILAEKIDENLEDFPVYVNLNDLGADFFNITQNNGGDIRITESDGTTEVPRELVFCDIGNEQGELHFKANLSNTDDNVFYIYYGNAAEIDYPEADEFGARNVWDDGYEAVFHLEEEGNNNANGYKDSSGNGNNGTGFSMTSDSDISGALGKGQTFDGSSDYISFGQTRLSDGYDERTLSLWTKMNTIASLFHHAAGYGSPSNGNAMFIGAKDDILLGGGYGGTLGYDLEVNDFWNITETKHLALTYDGSIAKLYEGETELISQTQNWNLVKNKAYIGRLVNDSDYWNGWVDEVRISSVVRSSAWISVEHQNQSSPNDFYTISAGLQLVGSGDGGNTNPLSITISGLTLGETYSFTATAVNGAGESVPSAPSEEVTIDYLPDPVTNLEATISDSQIDITWVAPENTYHPPNYLVEYKESTATNWIDLFDPETGTSETNASIPSLINGTKYDVRVAAFNGTGTSLYTTLDEGTTPYVTPDPPTGLNATVQDDASVIVNFVAPEIDGGGVVEYRIYTDEPDAAWYNAAWSGRSKLTILAENIDENLEDFPVYVNLNNLGTEFFNSTQNNGGDIRITNSTGTEELPRELVFCDIENEEGELHFKANLSNTDDNVFYIYYGNAAEIDYPEADEFGARNVWDDGYEAVFHLEEDGNNNANGYKDSSGNGNNGTGFSMTADSDISGALGKGQTFDGSLDYISFGQTGLSAGYDERTLSLWTKMNSIASLFHHAASYGSPSNGNAMFIGAKDDILLGGGYGGTLGYDLELNDFWNITEPKHLALTYDGSIAKLYEGETELISQTQNWNLVKNKAYIGRLVNDSDYWNGWVDEVRISSVVRSSAWISVEHQNQSSPNDFYTISAGLQLVGSGDGGNTNPLSITISGLTLGETYIFMATAVNGAGESAPSAPSNEVTIYLTPDPVENLEATALDSEIRLTWEPPLNTTFRPVLSYTIQYRESGPPSGDWITFEDVDSDVFSSTITELINGKSYAVQVAAVNSTGTGDFEEISDITPIGLPKAPEIVETVVTNDGSVTITFTEPDNNGAEIVEYQLFAKTSSETDYTQIAATTELFATIPVADLILGESYTFTVKAINAAGESDLSTPSDEVTVDVLPGPVTGLEATALDSQIDLTWTAPTNTHLPVPEYIIEYKASSATDWTLHPYLESPSTNASIPNLTNGTAYDVRVAAKNDAGNSDYSSLTNITPIGASLPPTGLTFSLLGGGAIELTWEEPDNTGGVLLTDYIIQYKEEFDLDYTTFPDGESTDRSETIGGLDNDQNYFFIVIAVNSEGESLPSEEIPVRLGEPGIISADGMEDTVYPDVTGVFSITNLGSQDYDYQYTWAITESATNTCGGGDDVAGSYDGSITLEPGAVFTGYPISSIASENLEDLPGYADFEEHGMTLYFHVQVEFGFEIRSDFYEFTLTSDAVVPDKPTILSTQPGDRRVGVSWLAPYNNGGDPIIRYHVEYRTGTGTWFDGGESAGTSKTVHGLTNGVQYDFRVYAENVIGNGEPSDIVSATPVYTPKAPTGLAASKASETSILFSWFEPGDTGGRPITDYIVEYRKYNGSWSGWQTYDDGESTEEETILTNLETDYLYELRVYAVNELGIGKRSGTVQVTLGSKPTAPRLTTDTRAEERIDLSISPPIDSGETPITDYQIEYKEGSGAWQIFTDGVNTSTSVLVPNLTTGVTYYFRAAAINGSGMGPYSDEVSDVPATYPGAPTNVVATANADGEIYLSFDYPAFDGHDAIIGYQSKSDPEGRTSSSMPIRVTLGETYTFTVCVRNDIGYGPYSEPSNEITPYLDPELDFSGPREGPVQVGSAPFYIIPNQRMTGTVTITPSGSAAAGIDPIVLNLNNTGSRQSFTIRPETEGNVTFTMSNDQGWAQEHTVLDYDVTPHVVLPDPPENIAAESGNGYASISFDPPGFDGNSDIFQYLVFCDPGNIIVPGNESPIIIPGLTNGETYTFYAEAVNSAGASNPSFTVQAIIPDEPPSLAYTFTGPVGGDIYAESGVFTITPESAFTDDITISFFGLGSETLTPLVFTFTQDLAPQTFTITPQSAGDIVIVPTGSQAPPPLTYAVTAIAPGPPIITGAIPQDGAVDLMWEEPILTGGSGITDYKIEYRTGTDAWTEHDDDVSTDLFTSVSDLINGTIYEFRVIAVNGVGEGGPSASVFVTPNTFTSPTVTTLGPTNIAPTTATLHAKITDTGGRDPMREIEWGTESGSYTGSCSAGEGGTGDYSCAIEDLSPGTIYYFRAKATNSNGTSYGEEICFTTLVIALGTVTNPETCSGASGSIEITGLMPLTQYDVEYLADGASINSSMTSNQAGIITLADLSAGIYSDIQVPVGACSGNTIPSVTLVDEQSIPGIFVDSFTGPTSCDRNNGKIDLSFTNVPNGAYFIAYDGSSFLGVEIINNLAVVESVKGGTYENLKVSVGTCTSSEDPDVTLTTPMPEITILEEIDPEVCGGIGEIELQVSNPPNSQVQLYYTGGTFSGRYSFTHDTPISIPATEGTYNNINIDYSTVSVNCTSINNPNASLSDPDLPEIEVLSTTDPPTCLEDGLIELAFNNVANGNYAICYNGGSFEDVEVVDNAANIPALAGLYEDLSITVAQCTSVGGPDVELKSVGTPSIIVSSISYPPNCASDGAINFQFSNVDDGFYTISYDGGSFGGVHVLDNAASVFAPVGNYIDLSITADGCTSVDNPDAIVTFAKIPTLNIVNIVDPTTCEGNGTIGLSFTNTPNGTYEIFYDGGSFPGVSVENNAAEITAVQGIYNNIYHTVGGCSSIDLPDAVVSDPEKPTLELLSHTDQTECNGKGRLELHITGLSSGQLFTIYHDDGQFPIFRFYEDNGTFNPSVDPGEYNNLYFVRNNCKSEEYPSATIEGFPIPEITLSDVQQPASCAETGTITIATTNVENGPYDFYYDFGVFTGVSVEAGEATINAPIGIYNNIRLEISNCITNEDIDVVIAAPGTPTIGIAQINQPANCIDGGSIDFVFTNVEDGSYTIDYEGGAFTGVEVTGNTASVSAEAGIYDSLGITVGTCASVEYPSVVLADPPAPNAYISYGSPQLPLLWQKKPLHTIGTTWDVSAEDFNGDGHLDMLAIVDNNKIAWYENNGLQTFTEHFIVSNANNIRAVFPEDINNDGKMDFMAAISHIDNKIVWYRNDGTGSFTEVIVTDNDDISGNYGDIFVKDMDSDGDKDVIVSDLYDLFWYENMGEGAFAGDKKTIGTDIYSIKSIFAADMDGDGKMDVLSASEGGELALHHNLGFDIFEEIQIPAELSFKYAVLAEDIDQDGDLDILSGGTNLSTFAWHENTAPLTYTLHSLSSSNERNNQVFAADMDNDGDIDLLNVFSYEGGSIYWHENDGSQNFTEHEIDSQFGRSISAVDMDQDGDQDILAGASGSWNWYDNQYLKPICMETSVSLEETGGDAVSWSWSTEGSGLFNNEFISNPSISDASNLDLVSVSIEDNLGCTSTHSIKLPITGIPTISVSVEPACGALEFSFTNVPDGRYNIDYDGGSFTDVEIVGNKASIAAETGSYVDLSISVFNCTSAEYPSVTVTQSPPGIRVIGTTLPEYCNGEGIIHLAFVNILDGTYDISYDGGEFNDVQINANAADIPAQAGTYNNLRISSGGCTSTEYPDVVLPDAPPLIVDWIIVTDPETCGGNGTIQFDVSYTLPSSGEYFLDVSYDGGEFENVKFDQYIGRIRPPAGVYDNIVLDFNGCRTTEYLYAELTDPPTATISLGQVGNPTFCEGSDGSISIEGLESGLEYDISYTKDGSPVNVSLWSDAEGKTTISGLAAGTYEGITAARFECASNPLGPIELLNPPTPSITGISVTDAPSCDQQGGIDFTFANVNDGFYTIYYDGSAFLGVEVTSLSASVETATGVYANLNITINGCTSTEYPTAIVNASNSPTIAVDTDETVNPSACGAVDGKIKLDFTNVGDGKYDILYDGGMFADKEVSGGSVTITTAAGTFENLKISNGACTSIEDPDVILVAQGAPTIGVYSFTSPSTCGENGTINFRFPNLSDGTYRISYDGGSFNSVVVSDDSASINTIPGVYNNLRVTNGGCTSSEDPDVTLVNPSAPGILMISSEGPVRCSENGEINLGFTNVADGVYTLNYSGGQFQNVAINDRIATISAAAGNYESISINIAGCQSVDNPDVVLKDPPLPIGTWQVSGTSINRGEEAIIWQSGSENDVQYQLRLDSDSTNVGAPEGPITGGAAFDFSVVKPNRTTAYHVLATNTITGCSVQLADTAIVTVDDEPLPIELLSFEVRFVEQGHKVQIDWVTSVEVNNDFFEVGRSVNGTDWELIATVQGAGTTSLEQRYSVDDNDPYMGLSYYRLKQTDFDGLYSYSPIRSVDISGPEPTQITIYPNPTSSHITIRGSEGELKQILVLNAVGQDITSLTNLSGTSGSGRIIDMTNLSPGIYFIKTKSTVSKVEKR
jgi:hypothetical protein